MKTFKLILVLFFASVILFAQAPEKMSYQSVIRDSEGMLIKNTTVGMKISILQGTMNGDAQYIETHTPTSNDNGLVTLEIGRGTILRGVFKDINWADGPYFIKVESDLSGGTNYAVTGTSQLLSVPYALFAKKAGALEGSITQTDSVFMEAEDGNMLTFDGSNWVAKDLVVANTGNGQAQNNMQPWIGINHIIALVGVFPSRNGSEPFIAEIIMFGGNFAPRGWAYCDGQLLSVSQNSALFSLLGTTYGGDGRTTFGLPDLRGRTAVHPGQGPGLTDRNLGQKGGSESNVMIINQMPAHTHSISYE